MSHIAKRLTQAQVVTILTQYGEKKLTGVQASGSLGLKRARFFRLLKRFRSDKENFALSSVRTGTKRISETTEKRIKVELEKEKKLIDDKDVPIRFYNYSAVIRQCETR